MSDCLKNNLKTLDLTFSNISIEEKHSIWLNLLKSKHIQLQV